MPERPKEVELTLGKGKNKMVLYFDPNSPTELNNQLSAHEQGLRPMPKNGSTARLYSDSQGNLYRVGLRTVDGVDFVHVVEPCKNAVMTD